MTLEKKITAATLIMSLATTLSRIAGLIRDVVIARFFGAGMVTDAFFMAFTIPNLLRRFFAEGSLTAAFVPVFSDVFHQTGEQEARELANRCVTLLLLVMLVIVSIGVFCSPWIVQLIGYGFNQVPGKIELTDQLNRLMFPYIGFVSVLALLTGILNVRGHFFLPSLSPLFLNLTMIISAVTMGHLFSQPIFALAVGVLLGGIVQLLLQYPVLLKYRVRLRLNFNFIGDPVLQKIVRLMIPGAIGVAIYQINIIVTRLMASFLPDGSLSWLYYGQRLFEFPQGIFIVSLAQAALPMMSRQVAENDHDGLQQSLRFSLTLITLFTLPAIVGLILCAKPVYSLFFFAGEFSLVALNNTAVALICYAPGLIFVGYSRIAVHTFYAMKDTKTPAIVSFFTLLVNLLAGLILMQPFGFAGLAAGLTISTLFNATALLVLLQRRTGNFFHVALLMPLAKILPVCTVMAVVVWSILNRVNWLQTGEVITKSMTLLAAVFFGAAVFLLGAYIFKVQEIQRGWFLLRRKVSRKTS